MGEERDKKDKDDSGSEKEDKKDAASSDKEDKHENGVATIKIEKEDVPSNAPAETTVEA